jgi:hypothetical protein
LTFWRQRLTASAKEKRITTPRRSVQQASFRNALCQALVRSTTHRVVAWMGAGVPFFEMQAAMPRRSSSARVTNES